MKNLRKKWKTIITLPLPANGNERVKENVTETVNDPVRGVVRPCRLVRGSTSWKR